MPKRFKEDIEEEQEKLKETLKEVSDKGKAMNDCWTNLQHSIATLKKHDTTILTTPEKQQKEAKNLHKEFVQKVKEFKSQMNTCKYHSFSKKDFEKLEDFAKQFQNYLEWTKKEDWGHIIGMLRYYQDGKCYSNLKDFDSRIKKELAKVFSLEISDRLCKKLTNTRKDNEVFLQEVCHYLPQQFTIEIRLKKTTGHK